MVVIHCEGVGEVVIVPVEKIEFESTIQRREYHPDRCKLIYHLDKDESVEDAIDYCRRIIWTKLGIADEPLPKMVKHGRPFYEPNEQGVVVVKIKNYETDSFEEYPDIIALKLSLLERESKGEQIFVVEEDKDKGKKKGKKK